MKQTVYSAFARGLRNRIEKAGSSRKIAIRPGICAAVCLMLTVFFSGITSAEVTIPKVFAYPGYPVVWFVKGLEGDVVTEGENATSASIGGFSCGVNAGMVRSEETYHYRTVIMIDNSASVSGENRSKIKDLVSRIIQNHTDREEFIIYTFSTELTQIGSGTDYAGLVEAVNNIEHKDQDTYLLECIAAVLEGLRESQDFCYNRIILLAEGVDDNPNGKSYADVLNMLRNDAYSCPVYTIASVWERDTSGRKNLQALSGESGAKTFVLDETENLGVITEAIAEDYDARYFEISVPLEKNDGTDGLIHLSVVTRNTGYELSRMVHLPGLTDQEEQEKAERQSRVSTAKEAIEALPESITGSEEDRELISAAEAALSDLNENEILLSLLRTELNGADPGVVIAQAESEYAKSHEESEASRQALIDAAVEAFKALPDPMTGSEEEEEKLKAAETALENLGSDETMLSEVREAIGGGEPAKILEQARTNYAAALERAAARLALVDAAEEAIKAIPDQMSGSEEDEEKILSAEFALADLKGDEELLSMLSMKLGGKDPAETVLQARKDYEKAVKQKTPKIEVDTDKEVQEQGETTIQITTVSSEGKDGETKEESISFFSKYGILLISGAVLAVVIIVFIALLLVRRRKNRSLRRGTSPFDSDLPSLHMGNNGERVSQEYPFQEHEKTEDEFLHPKTIGMFDEHASGNGKQIILTDPQNNSRTFRCVVRNESLIGRDNLCSIVIKDDKTISHNHCKLTMIAGNIYAEDLGSHNGTSVNGKKVDKSVQLHTGDELKLGKTRLRVEIL